MILPLEIQLGDFAEEIRNELSKKDGNLAM
jgi:hypothetical protein